MQTVADTLVFDSLKESRGQTSSSSEDNGGEFFKPTIQCLLTFLATGALHYRGAPCPAHQVLERTRFSKHSGVVLIRLLSWSSGTIAVGLPQSLYLRRSGERYVTVYLLLNK
jgi:hypothetical protein